MSLRRLIGPALVVLIGLVLFGTGLVVGGHPEATGLTRLPEPVRRLVLGGSGEALAAQVLAALRRDYYTEIDAERLERRSVDALVAALDDPYTVYLDPDELEALRASTRGVYVGVGIQLAERGGRPTVSRVFAGGSAAAAGVRVGDRIVSVDGTATAGRSLDQTVALIRGREGTSVVLGLARPGGGARREVTLERTEVVAPAVTSRVESGPGGRVGYVRLSQFTRGSADEVREAVERLESRDVTGIVVDLRGDPGGLVDEAVGVAGVFLAERTPVVTTEGRNSPRRTLRTSEAPAVPAGVPVVVLVDRSSASASEIVAGALRDGDRARLVGTRTFGKAVVQSTVPLRDGGALKLTTARYLTPDGDDISRRGLRPDVRVADDPATPPDEALRRAVAEAAR